MSIKLSDAARAEIDKCYRDNGWTPADQLSEYHLCEAAYRAGLAAGRAQGLEEAARVCDAEADMTIPGVLCSADDRDKYEVAAGCAAAIRSLLNT